MPINGNKIWPAIKNQWFLIGLFISIGIAAAYPTLGKKNGTIHAEITVSYIGIGIIFLLSGLSLKTKALMDALIYWKLILLVQTISLGAIPVISLGLQKLLLFANFDTALTRGVVISCCVPTTISSNVLMTKIAGGNEAASLVNAVVGSILGVFVSPSLIIGILGLNSGTSRVDYVTVFINLGITVIAPLLLGQVLRISFPKTVTKVQENINFAIINSFMLLLLVWSVFCDTFSSGVFANVSIGSLFAILFIQLALFLSFSLSSFAISIIPQFGFTKPDTIAIVMCSATKTIALGIPLINVIFSGDPAIGILSIPLLIYHAEQLLIGSFLVTWFQRWINKSRSGLTDHGSQ